MSLADEMLRNVSMNGGIPRLAKTDDTETEPHIVVGEDRFITVPEELQRIAVQYDHRAETVTFDCPRFWDGHDMSKMKIYINYTRADGLLGMYIAENILVDELLPNIMHFDWTLTRNVTGINGPIVFEVCVKRVDRDGNEEIHWNSERNLEMYVSEGLEGEEAIRNLYPDIFTQMLQRMDELEYIVKERLIEIRRMRDEFIIIMDETRTTVLNRADEIESIMTETQEMVEEISKIATPEAMKNYTYEYYNEHPNAILDAVDKLYAMAEDPDIDAIIGGTYVYEYNNFEDKFSFTTDPEIDAIIAGNYVDVPDSGGSGGDDIGGGDDDMIITDEEIQDIVDDLFNGDGGENGDISGGDIGVTEEDIQGIVDGTF